MANLVRILGKTEEGQNKFIKIEATPELLANTSGDLFREGSAKALSSTYLVLVSSGTATTWTDVTLTSGQAGDDDTKLSGIICVGTIKTAGVLTDPLLDCRLEVRKKGTTDTIVAVKSLIDLDTNIESLGISNLFYTGVDNTNSFQYRLQGADTASFRTNILGVYKVTD